MERDRRSTIFFLIAALLTCTGFGVVVHSAGYLRGVNPDDSSLEWLVEAAPRIASDPALNSPPLGVSGLDSDEPSVVVADGDLGEIADGSSNSGRAPTTSAQLPATDPEPLSAPAVAVLVTVSAEGPGVRDAADRSGRDEGRRSLRSGSSGSGSSGSAGSRSGGSGSSGSGSGKPDSQVGAGQSDDVDLQDGDDLPDSDDPPDSDDVSDSDDPPHIDD